MRYEFHPEALAERIYELLTNVDCREAMGHAARLSAEQFDWTIIAGRIVSLYKKLLTSDTEEPLELEDFPGFLPHPLTDF
ncbi:MAG TPA: hypothetical protein PKJ56_10085 [Promineifilum sp.]|nr:hypothetical protein [Promineifilum sp.]